MSGKGDVGQFILQQAQIRGGRPLTTNNPPAFNSNWSYHEDQYGIVIELPRSNYPKIEAFLKNTFGNPNLGPNETTDGGKLGVYRFGPKGGGIQFGHDDKVTQVIVLRPVSVAEISKGIQRAAEQEQFRQKMEKSQSH